MRIGDDIIDSYANDGAVCVRQAFSSREVGLAADAIESVLANPSPLAILASGPDDGAFIEDFRNWHRTPAMEEFIRESPAASICLLYTSPSPRDQRGSRMPSSA